jgi:hypothetical protein
MFIRNWRRISRGLYALSSLRYFFFIFFNAVGEPSVPYRAINNKESVNL